MQTVIQNIRSFNRLYVRRIGMVNRLLALDLPLPEQRVLLELARDEPISKKDIERLFDLDAEHLDRILARLEEAGWVGHDDGPDQLEKLTPVGEGMADKINARITGDIERLVETLGEYRARRLAQSLATANRMLGEGGPCPDPILREPRAGDLSYVSHRLSLIASRDFGFDETAEEQVLDIICQFAALKDPRSRAWIAELDGEIVGSVMLTSGDERDDAKLRLFYVEPGVRGRGIGSRLVNACVSKAREFGYRKLLLWTTGEQHSARKIFEAAGFTLANQDRHVAYGREILAQIWSLDLTGARN